MLTPTLHAEVLWAGFLARGSHARGNDISVNSQRTNYRRGVWLDGKDR
jgi:hypothetical protein